MAPTKRARPAFSPPRPRKTGGTSTKSTAKKGSVGKSKPGSSKSTTTITNKTPKPKSKSAARPASTNPRRRSNLVSPTPSASDSLGEDSDQDDNDNEANEDDDEDTNMNPNPSSSPEPDYILAEITHESPPLSTQPIPPGLIHRILHSHFSAPEKTKISTDARDVVGKYIEVFVREAIMRCAYEKGEGEVDGAGKDEGEGGGTTGGRWLDLEDLEKVAVQLCLDF